MPSFVLQVWTLSSHGPHPCEGTGTLADGCSALREILLNCRSESGHQEGNG